MDGNKSNAMLSVSICLPLLALILQTPWQMWVCAQQSDPCVDYTELRDPWRATSNTNQTPLHCDQDITLQGWYLLVDEGASVRMPNSCVPTHRCGTHAPIWMNGPHPTPAEGIVTRQMCGHWLSGCCEFTPPSIQVKACPGGYTVYQFVRPGNCFLAYCADLTSRGALPTPSPAPAPSSNVGVRLKVTATGQNKTAVEEEVLKLLEDMLQAGGVQVSGLRVSAVHSKTSGEWRTEEDTGGT